MAKVAIKGEELKKLLKLARKQELPFAFCPGSTESEHVFALHKLKSPKVLGSAAKKEGVGAKVAFGTLELEGNVLTVTCEREVPGIAKRLRKWLKVQKVMYNVVALGPDGEPLDSDGEDDGENQGAEVGSGIDATAATLIARIKVLQPAVEASTNGKLKKALTGSVKLVQAGEIEKATAMVEAIETALDSTKQSAGGSKVAVAKAKLAWETAKKSVDSQLTTLQQAILADFDDADSANAVKKLARVVARFNEGLGDTVDNLYSSADAAQRKQLLTRALNIAKSYTEYIQGDPVIAHLQKNPYPDMTISVSDTLLPPLRDLASQLAAQSN